MRCRSIEFLYYPVNLPHQAKAIPSDVAFQLGPVPISAKSEKRKNIAFALVEITVKPSCTKTVQKDLRNGTSK